MTQAFKSGFIQRQDLAVLQFSGSDLEKFLQGALSNDLRQLTDTQGLAACFLTPKGKLIAALKLLRDQTRIVAFTSRLEAQKLSEGMRTLLLFSDTTLEDLSTLFSVFGCAGEFALTGLKTILPELQNHSNDPLKTRSFHFENTVGFIFNDLGWVCPSALLVIPAQQTDRFQEALQSARIHELTHSEFEVLRIQSKIAKYGTDMNESNLPLEVGLGDFISYSKGCYQGQETISRLKHYGKTTKMLACVRTHSAHPAELIVGEKIFRDGKEVGQLTSAQTIVEGDQKEVIGLAVLQQSALETGAVLKIGSESVQYQLDFGPDQSGKWIFVL